MSKLEVSGKHFMFDGKPMRIISGAIHYFRVMPEYWENRLYNLKACGFNTVETYVAWNIHEPEPGQYNFKGMADICRFIQTAADLGLKVIVRPGPYICAEWECGGLPAWLLNIPDIKLRCYNKPYLDRVDMFYDVLFEKLKPYLSTNGGPIIAMQVENEYGSFGNDKAYLNYLRNGMIRRGIDVLLFTSDGPGDMMLSGGTLPDVLKTVNFGSNPEEAFMKLLEYQEDKPLMCMEFWDGWFDHWEGEHSTRDTKDFADVLDKILSAGASVNLYMFHGGTNFGFMSGANYDKGIVPTVTSYDYDSPLNEAGDPTEKYYAAKKILSKYISVDDSLEPKIIKKTAYGTVSLSVQAGLFESLELISKPVKSACPLPMEKLGQNYGFILYRTNISGIRKKYNLYIRGIHDRAMVFVDGKLLDTLEGYDEKSLVIDLQNESAVLDILVENIGRINYGPNMADMKGIVGDVRLDYQFIFNWTIYPLPLDNIHKLQYGYTDKNNAPTFFKGTFTADETADTFLLMDRWNKGVAFINGFNLGRYWSEGPQRTLYIPAPLIRKGENEIVIFELYNIDKPCVEFIDKPVLG